MFKKLTAISMVLAMTLTYAIVGNATPESTEAPSILSEAIKKMEHTKGFNAYFTVNLDMGFKLDLGDTEGITPEMKFDIEGTGTYNPDSVSGLSINADIDILGQAIDKALVAYKDNTQAPPIVYATNAENKWDAYESSNNGFQLFKEVFESGAVDTFSVQNTGKTKTITGDTSLNLISKGDSPFKDVSLETIIKTDAEGRLDSILMSLDSPIETTTEDGTYIINAVDVNISIYDYDNPDAILIPDNVKSTTVSQGDVDDTLSDLASSIFSQDPTTATPSTSSFDGSLDGWSQDVGDFHYDSTNSILSPEKNFIYGFDYDPQYFNSVAPDSANSILTAAGDNLSCTAFFETTSESIEDRINSALDIDRGYFTEANGYDSVEFSDIQSVTFAEKYEAAYYTESYHYTEDGFGVKIHHLRVLVNPQTQLDISLESLTFDGSEEILTDDLAFTMFNRMAILDI